MEKLILKETGYGFSLEKCVVTGEKENLVFLSPKSASAVSKEAGEKYKKLLFDLPKFFLTENIDFIEKNDIQNAEKINRHFLEKTLTTVFKLPFPQERIRLEKFFY